MKVVYAPRALRDLTGIAAYLTERNPSGAANVLGAIKSSIDTLNYFPRIGRVVDKAGHRRVPIVRYPYIIFYRIDGDAIIILHIRHTSRRVIDPPSEL